MKSNWWLKFGCFLIGYNYELLKECGEASRKSVKKYTSAMLIVLIIWIANGYNFASIYVNQDNILSGLVAALICSIIIVQIERQIILTMKPNKSLKRFRIALALLMALVGSVIIDQILFRQDLEDLRKKNILANTNLEKNYNLSRENLQDDRNRKIYQIRVQDSISASTRDKLNRIGGTSVTKYNVKGLDSTGKVISTDNSVKSIDVTPLIQTLKNDSISKANNYLYIEQIDIDLKKLSDEYEKNTKPVSNGFLGEIQLLFNFLLNSDSLISLFVYIFWFILLFILEMLVLIAKSNDDHSDYERRVIFELDNNNKKIDFLTQRSNDNLS
jgi:hypothetical protein